MLHLNMPAQHRTWCDACMRARGITGGHEKRESVREDEDPFAAMDHGSLKLHGTEGDTKLHRKLEFMLQIVNEKNL